MNKMNMDVTNETKSIEGKNSLEEKNGLEEKNRILEEKNMENEKREQERKHKSLVRFWIILICAMFVGGVLGFSMNFVEGSMDKIVLDLRDGFVAIAPFILWVVEVLSIVGCLVGNARIKRGYANWDGEDEKVYDRLDRKHGMIIGVSSISVILCIILFAVCMAGMGSESEHSANILLLICCVTFVISIVLLTFIQRKSVELVKKINPEKKGDPLDMNFNKTWLDSCDELERQKVYKAGYKAYAISPILFSGLFLVLIIGEMFLGWGIGPMLVMGIIWITQTVVYIKESL